MIINVGNRTDIPAFYSDWFYNRIDEGYVCSRNPFNPKKVIKYRLDPEVVDCLAFCTKNPKPMLDRLSKIDKFRQFWFVTITSYGKDIEPNVPDKKEIIDSFKKLSDYVGPDSVSVRYDPILIYGKYDIAWHIKCFDKLCESLEGYTHDIVISFLDLYEKVKKNAPELRPPSKEEEDILAKEFGIIGKKYGMTIRGCLEDARLSKYGLDMRGCMTKEVIEKAINAKLKVPSIQGKREGCSCLLGNEIGEYNTCMHLCKYCYANYSKEVVIENFKKHNKNSPLLIGNIEPDDEVVESKQKSWIVDNNQISLF